MIQQTIDKILDERRKAEAAASQPQAATEDKFFSILGGDGLTERFLELRFRSGAKTCFSYDDLLWFNFEPEVPCIDLEIGGYLITLKGRGLGEALFDGLKHRRVAWVKEADVEMQDHKGNAVFIAEITITPPNSASETEAEGE